MDKATGIRELSVSLSAVETAVFALLRENRDATGWDTDDRAALAELVAKVGAWRDLLAAIVDHGPANIVRALEEIQTEDRRGVN